MRNDNKVWGFLLSDGDVLKDPETTDAQLYRYTESHRVTQVKWENFMVFKFIQIKLVKRKVNPKRIPPTFFSWKDLTMYPWLAWNSLFSPGWLQMPDLPASVSRVLALKVCHHIWPSGYSVSVKGPFIRGYKRVFSSDKYRDNHFPERNGDGSSPATASSCLVRAHMMTSFSTM